MSVADRSCFLEIDLINPHFRCNDDDGFHYMHNSYLSPGGSVNFKSLWPHKENEDSDVECLKKSFISDDSSSTCSETSHSSGGSSTDFSSSTENSNSTDDSSCSSVEISCDSGSSEIIFDDSEACFSDSNESSESSETSVSKLIDEARLPPIDGRESNNIAFRCANAVAGDAKRIADMVNILSDPNACENVSAAMKKSSTCGLDLRNEDRLHPVYDDELSQVMNNELANIESNFAHVASRTIGHVVEPGCISFYKYCGKTYAASEGKWYLSSVLAAWVEQNVSIEKQLIAVKRSHVKIMHVLHGEIGLVTHNGTLIMLDEGTHVFNSNAIKVVGIDECSML